MNHIDHAAQALAQLQSGRKDWALLESDVQEHFRQCVRTVLESLRDADEQMVEAGAEIIRNVGSAESEMAYLNDAATTWRFMIDALLEEKV